MTMGCVVPPGARSFPGEACQVGEARRFVARALEGCPARERLLTCVSELAANAVEHTESGAGGTFTVTVRCPREGVALVSVADDGGAGEPATGGREEMSESGRGLALVDAFSSHWGCRRAGRGHLVWAEATWLVPADGPAGACRRPPGLWQDAEDSPARPQGVA